MGEGTVRAHGRALTVVAVAALGLVVGACAPPPSDPPPHAVDQQNSAQPWSVQPMFCGQGDPVGDAGQSFKPSRPGLIDQVSLVIERALGPGDFVLQVEIRTVDAYGLPTSQILGAGTYSGPSSPELPGGAVPSGGDFIDIPLSQPAQVSGGTTYAIVVREPDALKLHSCLCNDAVKSHFEEVLRGVYPDPEKDN